MKIAPSLLNSDWNNLQSEIDSVSSADRIHLDIMDGIYVKSKTFTAQDFANIQWETPFEVHLMVSDPENWIDDFLRIGASTITFQLEAIGLESSKKLLKKIRERKAHPGICIDGYTDETELDNEILTLAHQILVMSVKSGLGGQKFMPEALKKVQTLRRRGYKGEIEIDGGIYDENWDFIKENNIDVAVMGSFLMKQPCEKRNDLIQTLQT